MKSKIQFILIAGALCSFPNASYEQVPLGGASSFALFTAAGAFNGDAATFVIGDIGTNVGAFTPTGAYGVSHVADAVAAQAAIDVASAYGALSTITCGMVIGTTLGNGQVLLPNVYCLGAASTVNGNLTLDGQGDPNAVFVFQINGALATSNLSSISLINGAQLCNVYWQVNGAFAMGTNAIFKGTVIAEGAITFNTGAALNGRALTTAGLISTSSNLISLIFCNPPSVTCPIAAAVQCSSQVPLANPGSVGVTVTCVGLPTVISLGDIISNQTCSDRYSIVRTYQATDACGLKATCSQAITVNDQTPPIITCPANITLACTDPTPPAVPGSVLTADNCGGVVNVILANQMIVVLSSANRLAITRIYCATDLCGNSASCTQTIIKM